MSETPHSPAGTSDGGRPIDYGTAASIVPTGSGLLRLGGGLGIAACCVGLAVMVAACAGLNMALVLSLVPVGLSAVGLVVSIVGAVFQKRMIAEDTHVMHALFANMAGLIGGLLEMTAWRHWQIFAH
jgi:hypothetical protein